jgi:hypothetical protein
LICKGGLHKKSWRIDQQNQQNPAPVSAMQLPQRGPLMPINASTVLLAKRQIGELGNIVGGAGQ